MPFASSDGSRLYYRVEGRDDRPVLVLSNSLGTDFGMWAPQVPTWMERYKVLLYDGRGHGASDAPDGEYSIDQLGRDVLAVADAAGVETFAFCGLSIGGFAGQWLAIHAPERLSAAVLANTSAHLPPPENWSNRMKVAREQGMGALADPVIERFFSEEYRQRDEPLLHSVRRTLLNTSPVGYAGCCAAVRDADFRAGLARISTPTLVIGGDRDVATPPDEHGRPLADAIPGARYAALDAGHVSNLEAPAEFAALVMDFVPGG